MLSDKDLKPAQKYLYNQTKNKMKDYHFGTSGSIFSLSNGPIYTRSPVTKHSMGRFSNSKWYKIIFLGVELQYYFLHVCMLHCKQKWSLRKLQKMMSTKLIRLRKEFVVFLTIVWTVLINSLHHWGISFHLKWQYYKHAWKFIHITYIDKGAKAD